MTLDRRIKAELINVWRDYNSAIARGISARVEATKEEGKDTRTDLEKLGGSAYDPNMHPLISRAKDLNRRIDEEAKKLQHLSDQLNELLERKTFIVRGNTDLENLRAFANAVIDEFHPGTEFLQEIAVKHGILTPRDVFHPCKGSDGNDGYCYCEDYGFPTICYRKAEVLKDE